MPKIQRGAGQNIEGHLSHYNTNLPRQIQRDINAQERSRKVMNRATSYLGPQDYRRYSLHMDREPAQKITVVSEQRATTVTPHTESTKHIS